MDNPLNSATEAYKVGGVALVCLVFMGVFGWVVLHFLFKHINRREARINAIEDRRQEVNETIITVNTASNLAVVAACDRQSETCKETTKTLAQLVTVLGERPCFTTQNLPAIRDPEIRRHRTPLPQKYTQP